MGRDTAYPGSSWLSSVPKVNGGGALHVQTVTLGTKRVSEDSFSTRFIRETEIPVILYVTTETHIAM
jgi:hypothetical protein